MNEIKFVTYEEFGAIGDGVHDDMPAIVAAHDYANENGLPVRAKDGAKYYIGKEDITAIIKTNTNFGDAEFIIDDRILDNIHTWCFKIPRTKPTFTPEIKSLKHNQAHVDFPHEGNVYVMVTSTERRVFIRKGPNMNNGSDAKECFLVDKDGNVLNGINWDYDVVTSAYAFNIDEEPIVVEGGTFTTIANQWICEYAAHNRGIYVGRSNVTVKGIKHYITGELDDHGAPYSGFLRVHECANVTVTDCLLTPHLTYDMPSKIPGQMVPMGTYDLGFNSTINVHLINTKQTIDLLAPRYWGIMGSNFCKELHYDGCYLSRYDAHCGVTNGSIKNTTIGVSSISLIGFGEFVVENTTVYRQDFITFRSDYGSTFQGTLIIKNCRWEPRRPISNMFIAWNSGDHDFGYECSLPETIIIDGLVIDDTLVEHNCDEIVLFNDYDKDFAPGKPFPFGTPKKLVLKNITVKSGRKLKICNNPELFPFVIDTVIE